MKIILECNQNANTWKKTGMIDSFDIKKYMTKIITEVMRNVDFKCRELTISTLLTTDKKIQELNKEYRKKDKPTNVLSFSYIDEEDVLQHSEKYKNEDVLLGELIFGYETILKEAQEKAWPMECSKKVFQDHLSHLIVHGTLHLLGFDHEKTEKDAEKMESLEIKILEKLGISNPYEMVE